jgi:outer membrane protein TolC
MNRPTVGAQNAAPFLLWFLIFLFFARGGAAPAEEKPAGGALGWVILLIAMNMSIIIVAAKAQRLCRLKLRLGHLVRRAMPYQWLLVWLLGLSPSALASAQEPAPLSLDALVREVAARSPVVAAEARRAEAMRRAIPRARALDDPQITLMTEDIPTTLTGGMPMLRLQANQMLPWPGKRERMTRVAERESQVVGARERAVMLDAVTQAKRIYYGLYLNMEARRVNREQRAIAETLVDVVTGRLASGMAMHHDVLKMQTEASMLDDELTMLEAERQEMVAMLNALRDLPAEEPVGEPLEAWSPEVLPERSALVTWAIAQRPEVLEMVAMAESRRAMAEVARREYYPDFMLGAFYDARRGGDGTIGAMVTVSVPLWIGRKQRIDVAVADLRANAADRDRIAMEAMVRAEVEQAIARLSRAKRRSEILETELLDRAQQTFDAALTAFPAGKTNVLEILDALRVVSQRRLSRSALRVERELALVDLARAVGDKGEVFR